MSSDSINIIVIFFGLIAFTYMIYLSRRQKKKLGDRKNKIKHEWRDRL